MCRTHVTEGDEHFGARGSAGDRRVAPNRGPITGAPRFSLAFGERKAGRGKKLRLAIKSRSHRHGAGGELNNPVSWFEIYVELHMPKMSIGQYGAIALSVDTEGNLFGLQNPPASAEGCQ